MKRRTFLQLLGVPALASLWPRAAQAQQQPAYDGLTFTDSAGTPALDVLKDNDLTTGVEYLA